MRSPRPGQVLTGREVEVLSLVAAGLTNKGIGEALGLSVHTVKRHVERIAVKLRASTRAAIVRVGLGRGLVADGPSGPAPTGLTPELISVLRLMAEGLSQAAIARRLRLNGHTVHSRVVRIYEVLGVRCRAQAVVAGVGCGAVDLSPFAPVSIDLRAAASGGTP